MASPYATGGGGTVLEHTYGAVLLAALLQGHPVPGLGNAITPRQVAFQQAASCPVDDLVVVGDGPTGSRLMAVGVRRAPTISGGSAPFVTLLVDYLRAVIDRQSALDGDRERLALAVAAPHSGANEVEQLAFWARKRPDDAAFRDFIAAPKHTNGKVRARLRHLDSAVQAAVKQGRLTLGSPAEADALTWRLLKALRIIELRLEGDDPADATNVVSQLVPLAGGAARAVALWQHLLYLSAQYAQSAAIVTLDMLVRDVSAVVQVPGPASVPMATRAEQVNDRLRQLPAACGPRLLAAWRDDQDLAWRLIAAVTGVEDRPAAVLGQWQDHCPEWLGTASWQVQLAAGELAASYGAGMLAAELFIAAADQGAPRRSLWLARAAMIYEGSSTDDGRRQALATLHSATADEPYAEAVAALLRDDPGTASRIVEAWVPDHPSDRTLRAALRVRLAGPGDPRVDLSRDMLDRGLHVLADALREQWVPGLAAARAELLIIRARRGESPNWDADLREARTLALRARDERRMYRGDSPEAVALACHASLLLMDLRQVLALGAPGGDALPVESASPQVCEYVAFAALHLDALDLARDCATRLTHAATIALIGGYLTKADGGDPSSAWWRAAELADDDEKLAQALLALATAGVDGLTRFPAFAARYPDEAAELQAVAELAAGRPGAAIGRLRQRRRSSITAALSLAMAYQKLGNTDDQAQTLRDAADHFNDPSLRHAAAEALARADRIVEAQAEVDALLARTSPQWSGRADALRLATHLASRDARLDEMCHLLHAVLEVEPGDSTGRWALIRTLLQRGDLNAAWRVLHDAPEPLEPSNPADARAWVKMSRRLGQPADTVTGCLRLLRRFGDDEQFVATVLINFALPWPTPVELPDDVRAGIAAETERFFQRWPDSIHLRRIQTIDQEQLRADLVDMARRSDDEQQHWRRLVHNLARGTAPLCLLAAMARRSYTEICLYRADGVLPAHKPDLHELTVCTEAARSAEDHDIVLDVPAITVILALPDDIRMTVTARFARVITADDVMLDALNARDTLNLRSTASWRYDEQQDHLLLDETTEAEADRLALEANRLHDAVEALNRLTPPSERIVGNHASPAVVTWAAPLDLARARGATLWSDDPALRALARAAGVPTTSTLAVLRHLTTSGAITDDRLEQCIRTLIKARIGDFPLNEQRLLELAEDDNWNPAAVAAALSRPASWADPLRALALYRRIVTQVNCHAPATLPHWLYAAVRGSTLLAHPEQATGMAAALLTATLKATAARGERVAHLLAAARQALADTAHPDQAPAADPLPTAVTLLRDDTAKLSSHQLAAHFVTATFSALPDADRNTVAKAMLVRHRDASW
ncbi:PIN domain-containing protein [Dactylosporangium sp. CA-139066]|uniref:PIN domain-containing protein n=1 Tax=Dactylosporangium sp. CA-139066 TaxID=3239930 RepID=UPI003D92CD8B